MHAFVWFSVFPFAGLLSPANGQPQSPNYKESDDRHARRIHAPLLNQAQRTAVCAFRPIARKSLLEEAQQNEMIRYLYDQEYLAPPYKHSFYFHQSRDLGVLALTLNMAWPWAKNFLDFEKTYQKFVSGCILGRPRGGDTSLDTSLYYPLFSKSRDSQHKESVSKRSLDCNDSNGPIKDPTYDMAQDLKELEKSVPQPHTLYGQRIPTLRPRGRLVPRESAHIVARDSSKVIVLPYSYGPDMYNLAQPSGVDDKRMGPFYAQYQNSGNGVVVYIYDSGLETQHPDFANARIRGWLYPGRASADEMIQDDSDYSFHGTRVASKIVGSRLGLAQDADLIVVRRYTHTSFYETRDVGTTIDTWLQIYDDILSNPVTRQAKGILINVSSATEIYPKIPEGTLVSPGLPFMRNPLHQALEFVIRSVSELPNVIIVCAAGNLASPTAVDMRWLPQGLASTRKNIINVAGHDPITMSNIYQTGPHVRISAPAWNVMTAKVSYEGDDRTYEYGEFNGTSYAAPAVTGMLAMWISTGLSPNQALDHMAKVAWRKTSTKTKALFNGIKKS